MCFSAGASFGSGIVLSAIGIASLREARTSSTKPFAAIPLIFALQQMTEGVVWTALRDPSMGNVEMIATYLFLFLAQVVWPLWVPFSIYKLETEKELKKNLRAFLVIGTLLSLYLGYCLSVYHVQGRIEASHIFYQQDYPSSLGRLSSILYVVATIIPNFFSRIRGMRILGVTIFISCIITFIFYRHYIVSVWCFFAALISVMVYMIVREMERDKGGQVRSKTSASL
jgi:hypothetical protein